MEVSVEKTVKNIFILWKTSYLSLFPFALLSTLCFSNPFWDSYLLAVLLCFPGLYFYNIILLKLAHLITAKTSSTEIYSTAFSRFPTTLLLFLGLGVVALAIVVIFYAALGLIASLLSALIILVIYSYLIFSYPLVVIDQLDPVSAIKKSVYFINRHMWFITVVFLITGIVEGVIYLIGFLWLGENLGPFFYSLIFTTFNLSLTVVVLEDLKKSS